MPTEPFNWNFLVVGDWNVAILTPDGIRRRLFELPEGTPMDVEVSIDRPRPPMVSHGGIRVVPMTRGLEIALITPDRESLLRASVIAQRALVSLPETPVTALGMNIRYRCDPLPDVLIDVTSAELDNVLSDAAYDIATRSIRRRLVIDSGFVNLEIVQEQAAGGIAQLNFHCESEDPRVLGEWAGRAVAHYELSRTLLRLLHVLTAEEEHAS